MFFLLFLLDDRMSRSRIHTSDLWIRIRIQEAQNHVDPDPQHCQKHMDPTDPDSDPDHHNESYSVTCQEDYEASLPAELKERHERREEELSGPPPGTKSASHKKRGKAPRFSTPKVWLFQIKYLHGTKVKRDTLLFFVVLCSAQGCGSGSELDPDSIRSVDPDPDPDPGGQNDPQK
jgi:hypothetical protein